MSLINEALKRARQAQGRQPRVASADTALQPVVQSAPADLPYAKLIPVAGVTFLLLSFWFLSLWWRHSRVPSASATAAPLPPPASTHGFAGAMKSATAVAAKLSSNNLALAADSEALSSPVQTASIPTPAAPSPSPLVALPNLPIQTTVTNLSEAPVTASGPLHSGNEAPPPSDPAPSPAAALKLQGIFYRLSRASALIDGQTLFVGDEIDGAKIVAIERQSVRLMRGSQAMTLKLR